MVPQPEEKRPQRSKEILTSAGLTIVRAFLWPLNTCLTAGCLRFIISRSSFSRWSCRLRYNSCSRKAAKFLSMFSLKIKHNFVEVPTQTQHSYTTKNHRFVLTGRVHTHTPWASASLGRSHQLWVAVIIIVGCTVQLEVSCGRSAVTKPSLSSTWRHTRSCDIRRTFTQHKLCVSFRTCLGKNWTTFIDLFAFSGQGFFFLHQFQKFSPPLGLSGSLLGGWLS